MIRQATDADIPRILELGKISILSGPYRDMLTTNPSAAAARALEIIHERRGTVVVYEDPVDQVVKGLLAFFIFPHYFTHEPVAGELMWYVLPEARKGTGAAVHLLWEAQILAKQQGAKRFQFTAPSDDVRAMYEKSGYKYVESTYSKEL